MGSAKQDSRKPLGNFLKYLSKAIYSKLPLLPTTLRSLIIIGFLWLVDVCAARSIMCGEGTGLIDDRAQH